MAQDKEAKADDKTDGKKPRDRSPSYPFISLKTAVDRMATFDKYFGRRSAPMDKVGLAWGFKEKSSQAFSTLAALKTFGLIDYEDNRTAGLSTDGRNYLRAQQDAVKQEILRRCALNPKSIKIYWDKWGSDRPPNPICLDELVLKGGFTDSAAPLFLRVYDETIAFAGLSNSDNYGTILNSAIGEDSPAPTSSNEEWSARFSTQTEAKRPQVKTGMTQAVFPLEEGEALLQMPDRFSKESFEDFKAWIDLLLKKAARTINDAPTDDAGS